MILDVYDIQKNKVGSIDLPDSVYAAKVNEFLFWEVVKSQLASRRAGTVAVKNRSLVRGGGKKPYKQKGTGRARQGSIRASHWVGGGKAMGPKPRDYSFRVPAKVRQGALRSALSLRASEQKLFIVDQWAPAKPKSKDAAAVLAKFGVEKALVVDSASNQALSRSLRNLVGHDFLAAEGLNVYDLLDHDTLILTSAVAKSIGERLSAEKEAA